MSSIVPIIASSGEKKIYFDLGLAVRMYYSTYYDDATGNGVDHA